MTESKSERPPRLGLLNHLTLLSKREPRAVRGGHVKNYSAVALAAGNISGVLYGGSILCTLLAQLFMSTAGEPTYFTSSGTFAGYMTSMGIKLLYIAIIFMSSYSFMNKLQLPKLRTLPVLLMVIAFSLQIFLDSPNEVLRTWSEEQYGQGIVTPISEIYSQNTDTVVMDSGETMGVERGDGNSFRLVELKP